MEYIATRTLLICRRRKTRIHWRLARIRTSGSAERLAFHRSTYSIPDSTYSIPDRLSLDEPRESIRCTDRVFPREATMASGAVDTNAWDTAEPSPGISSHADKRRELNLLHVAWSSRWLIVLCMIVGGVGGWVALQRVVPRCFPIRLRQRPTASRAMRPG